jgi:hypothetical protein
MNPARAQPEPDLPVDLIGRAWTQILQAERKKLGPSPVQNAVFSYFTL